MNDASGRRRVEDWEITAGNLLAVLLAGLIDKADKADGPG